MKHFSLVLALFASHILAQTGIGPTSGLPAPVLTGSTSPAAVYTCDSSHQGIHYKQIAPTTGTITLFGCSTVSGNPTWVQEADTYGTATAAFTGDVTKAAGSQATTVSAVNGASIPVNAAVLGTNASGQLVAKSVSAQAVAGENVVTFSATPTFNSNVALNVLTLTGNVTSFALAAPTSPGAQTCLAFVQGATLPYTVTPPSNVVGLMALSTLVGKRNVQCFSYSAQLSLWLANGPGAVGI